MGTKHRDAISDFGKALDAACDKQGTSRVELARAIGMNEKTLNGWCLGESGEGAPVQALWMAAIIDELGCSPLDLVHEQMKKRDAFQRITTKHDSGDKPSPDELGAWWDTLSRRERKKVLGWIRDEGLPGR